MPPKKPPATDTWTGKAGCRGRDVTPLQQYILDKSKQRGYLASLLNKDGFLDRFAADVSSNECAFTFEDSDWFAVYLVDDDGQYFLDADGGRQPGRLFFHVMMDPANRGEVKIDPNSRTFTMPPELVGKRECMVSPSGTCVIRQVPKEPKTPKTPKAPKAEASSAATPTSEYQETLRQAMEMLAAQGISVPKGAAKAAPKPKVVKQPVEEVTKAVEQLQVGGGGAAAEETIKGSITTADLSSKSVDEIIQWMVENMYEQDVMSCLRSGTLSPEEQAKLAELQGLSTEAVVPEPGEAADEIAVQAAATLPKPVVQKMLQRISKASLSAEINAIKDKDARRNAIVELCQRAGLNYTIGQSRRGPRILDIYGEPVDDDKALSECASWSALRADYMLTQKIKRRLGPIREYVRGNIPEIWPDFSQPSAAAAEPSAPGKDKMTVDELMMVVENASDRKQGILQACEIVGINVVDTGKINRRKEKVYEVDGELISTDDDFEGILEDCVKKVNTTSFGKKKNFIQEANARSRRKGTMGTFGRWCRRNHLDVNGKVSLRCINKAKKSGNTKLIRRAVYAQNIKAYAGAKKKRRTSFGKKKSKAVEIFKKAAKKCKGSSDYRKCFTKTLRKMHNTSFGRRTRPRVCKRLKKRSCRSNPQCRWSGRRKGQKVKSRCVRRRKVYEGPALPPRRYKKTSFGRMKKKKSRKIPNNKKLGPRLKGYSGKEPKLSVFVRINGKMYEPRVSKSTKKGYLKAVIKGKKYHFKLKGPEKYVTLTPMKATRRRASFLKRKKPTPRNRSQEFIYRKRSTHPKRKSPRVSATSVSVGTVKKGVDGNQWKVKKTKTGVKR